MMSTPVASQLPTEDTLPATRVKEALEAMGAEIFYEKALTSSDASGSGRIVIPKAIAEMYFPILENQAGIPIDAIDSMGNAYFFRFRFWINNQSRMYLLEGAAELQRRYNLHVSDVMIFAHKPDKTLVVAGRPLADTDIQRKSGVKKPSNGNSSSAKRDLKRNSGYSRSSLPKKPRRTSARDIQGSALHHEFNPFMAPIDGVFRFLLHSHGLDRSAVFFQSGVWTAVLDIKGEMYQAFFDSHNDALTAFNAAGYI